MSASNVIIFLIIYSLVGWLYESILCSIINERKIINRGFLIGPYLPIYGFGAILVVKLLYNISNVYQIFIYSMLVCTTIEYITALSMERIFNAVWWDYSSFPFNYKGRISLYASIVFGILSTVLITQVHPILTSYISEIPLTIQETLSMITLIILFADLLLTLNVWTNGNKYMKKMYTLLSSLLDLYIDKVNQVIGSLISNEMINYSSNFISYVKNINTNLKEKELQMISFFSIVEMKKYKSLIFKK